MSKGRLSPLLNKLESVYMHCTYSHGQHTSRSNTCYTQSHQGIYDHIIYTPEKLRVLELLEIPQEAQLSPFGAIRSPAMQSNNHVTLLPNIVYPSSHLRLEAILQFLEEPV